MKQHTLQGTGLLTAMVILALVLVIPPTGTGQAQAAPVADDSPGETDPSGMATPAWYDDAELSATWKRFTGRYIFEHTCTSCHEWGPSYWTRTQWQSYFESFPENHEPAIPRSYDDLTAMFRPVNYVPSSSERHATLLEFLLSEAPEVTASDEERLVRYDSLPHVGDVAPDFEIVDVEGHRHRVSDYRGKKQLVLVFSRAHW